MTENHPITPPPNLVQEWLCDDNYPCDSHTNATVSIAAGRLRNVAIQAARWGADQELEACCEWLEDFNCSKRFTAELRAARRPKPPSLKEQALEALEAEDDGSLVRAERFAIIRRALESLPS